MSNRRVMINKMPRKKYNFGLLSEFVEFDDGREPLRIVYLVFRIKKIEGHSVFTN